MYGIFDIALDSDIPLPELPEVDTANAVISVQAGRDPSTIPEQPEWFHHWKTPEGEVCISCAKLGDSYLLRFPELADFVISCSGNAVSYFPQSKVPAETIRHLLLDQVVPRLLGQRGQLILHAAAVVMQEGQAIAFVGASGIGKSTLASSFYQNGAKLITDDCLLLDEREGKIVAIPNYFGLRLFNDSANAIFGEQLSRSPVAHYTAKNRLVIPSLNQSGPETNFTLSAIFLLSDFNGAKDEAWIVQVNGVTELMALIEQSFLLDVSDKGLIAQQFKKLGSLVANGPKVYRLEYPREHSALPLVRSSVEKIL